MSEQPSAWTTQAMSTSVGRFFPQSWLLSARRCAPERSGRLPADRLHGAGGLTKGVAEPETRLYLVSAAYEPSFGGSRSSPSGPASEIISPPWGAMGSG